MSRLNLTCLVGRMPLLYIIAPAILALVRGFPIDISVREHSSSNSLILTLHHCSRDQPSKILRERKLHGVSGGNGASYSMIAKPVNVTISIIF